MKVPYLFIAVACLSLAGCSKNESTADKLKADVKAIAADVKEAAIDSWDSIKDFTYEKRSDFSTRMDRMSGQMDDKVRELKAKAASASDATRAKALQDYDAARADLSAKRADLAKATAETWADAKSKVAQAWDRVVAAYNRAK